MREPNLVRARPREEPVEIVPVGVAGQVGADDRTGKLQGERLAEHRNGPEKRSVA